MGLLLRGGDPDKYSDRSKVEMTVAETPMDDLLTKAHVALAASRHRQAVDEHL